MGTTSIVMHYDLPTFVCTIWSIAVNNHGQATNSRHEDTTLSPHPVDALPASTILPKKQNSRLLAFLPSLGLDDISLSFTMLTTAPHLHVRRPSPTTAEFTVTTCPPLTFSVRLLLGILFLMRVLLGLSVLLLLHSSWTVVPQYQPQHHAHYSGSGSGGSSSSTDAIGGQQQLLLQSFPNATAAVGGDNAAAIVIDATATATATPSSVYEYNNYYSHQKQQRKQQQQYETIHSTARDDDKVAVVAVAAHPVEVPETQQIAMLQPRPDTLWTLAWAPYVLQEIHASPPGQFITTLTQRTLPPSLVFPLCLLLLYLTTQRIHTTESLLVLRGLGIQTSSTVGNYLHHWPFEGGKKTRFIPTEKIRDVLINEAFRGFGVRYYLVVVVDGEEDVVVVFPSLLPRRAVVERVWRGVRGCLWEPQDGFGMASGGNGATGKRGEENKTSSSG